MTCKLYQTELSEYLDGELPAARVARLEAHLRVCPHCQGELQELSGISGYIRAASLELRVSQDFDRRVLRAVATYQVAARVLRRRRSLLRPLVVAGIIFLGLLGALQRLLLSRPPVLPLRAPQAAAAAAAPAAPAPMGADREDR